MAQVLIAVVVFFNLQAALLFIVSPARYSPGFEVNDIPGIALVRGMGILFVMWNVPYLVALADPGRHRTSLYEAIVMQAIGLVGETILLATLPDGHLPLRATATRFIYFDAVGLVLLTLAAILTIRKNKVTVTHSE